jgi:hypothetical protein
MAGCVWCLSRRAFVLGTLGTALAAGAARAQSPEAVSETLARGRVDLRPEGAPTRVPAAPPVVPDCA